MPLEQEKYGTPVTALQWWDNAHYSTWCYWGGWRPSEQKVAFPHMWWIIELHVGACLDCRLSPPSPACGSASQSHWWPLPLPPGSDLCLTLGKEKRANKDAVGQCGHTEGKQTLPSRFYPLVIEFSHSCIWIFNQWRYCEQNFKN